jgi:poly-gamma-glutamate capsule biosynthesis protein CapA/YwtB (metallophosphatase superfamily)
VRLGLAGDTMLGRGVTERLAQVAPERLVSDEVAAAAREADVLVLNLECCISERGSPWPDPLKPFFFRAPPQAVALLHHLGVDCVTLANNHALDFGEEALLDTFEHLRVAGIASVGAGEDVDAARAPVRVGGLAVVAFADHPEDYAAGPSRPGIALDGPWVEETIAGLAGETVLVTPHWGPNMAREPVERVRRRAPPLLDAGASLVAGHSAHAFHGAEGRVLWDLGDFLDDYRIDPVARNDLGLLWLVDLDPDGPRRLEAVPLALDYCFTRLAEGEDAAWIHDRFRAACAAMGTDVREERGRLVVEWPRSPD